MLHQLAPKTFSDDLFHPIRKKKKKKKQDRGRTCPVTPVSGGGREKKHLRGLTRARKEEAAEDDADS